MSTEILYSLVYRLNETINDIHNGITPDNNFNNGRVDGLIIAIKTALEFFEGCTLQYDEAEAEYFIMGTE